MSASSTMKLSNDSKKVLLEYLKRVNCEGILTDTIMYMTDQRENLSEKQIFYAEMIIKCLNEREKQGIDSTPGDKTGMDDLLLCPGNCILDDIIKLSLCKAIVDF